MSRLRITEGAETSAIESALVAWGRSHLLADEPYRTDPPHALLLADALDYAFRDDARTAIAREDGEVTGCCVWRNSAWDAETFGFPVGRIEVLAARDEASAVALARWAEGCERDAGIRFSSVRLSSDELPVIAALEGAGYRFQETNLYPWQLLRGRPDLPQGVIRPATAEDIPRMREIAASVFTTDRFHNDPGFSDAQADNLYVRWVDSWFSSEDGSKRSRVLIHEDCVAGMLLWRNLGPAQGLPHTAAVLVLGGVDTTLGIRGLGKSLWGAGLNEIRQSNDYLTTTISLRNTAVLNLYVGLGFRFTSSDVTLHRWY